MKHLLFISKLAFLLSFTIGTSLVILLFYFSNTEQLISIGISFIIIALLINGSLFVIQLIVALFNKMYRIKLLLSYLLLTLNIPIAIGYFLLIIKDPLNRLEGF